MTYRSDRNAVRCWPGAGCKYSQNRVRRGHSAVVDQQRAGIDGMRRRRSFEHSPPPATASSGVALGVDSVVISGTDEQGDPAAL